MMLVVFKSVLYEYPNLVGFIGILSRVRDEKLQSLLHRTRTVPALEAFIWRHRRRRFTGFL